MSINFYNYLPKRQEGDFLNNAMLALVDTDNSFSSKIAGWGNNTTGVLANGVTANTDVPIQGVLFDPNTATPPNGVGIADWAFTNANLYVVYSNGWVYSAGKNDYGQLGHGDTVSRPYLKRIEYFVDNAIQIGKVWAAGAAGATSGGGCVYFGNSTSGPEVYGLYACGANAAGNLANANTPTSNVLTPAPCAGSLWFTPMGDLELMVSAVGANFSTYVLNGDILYVAGYNYYGQLGTGNTSNVTGGFVPATFTGGSLPAILYIWTTAGSSGGSALAVDGGGNLWTTGYNAYGQLGLGDTANRNVFTQIPGLTGTSQAGIGGGYAAYAYAIDASGTLYTWGYNGLNNLFKNNSTTPVMSPSTTVLSPGQATWLYFPKGDALGTSGAQLIAQTADNRLIYAGADNGQLGVASAIGGYKIIPTPQFPAGIEVSQVFVHGTGTTQRLFVYVSPGILYACGNNADSICTGGLSSNNNPTNVACFSVSSVGEML